MSIVVAHVVHRLYRAGAEVLVASLSRRLRDQFSFVFICLDEIGPLGHELAEDGFPVLSLDRQPGIDLKLARRMRAACREHQVDILHAHQYTPFFYSAISRGMSGKPRVLFTEHGRHYPDIRRPKRVAANQFLLRRRDRVTAVGEFVKRALVTNEGLPARRIDVIYNGIDLDQFGGDDGQAGDARESGAGALREQVRSSLGLEATQPVMLQVARFHSVKDHATAIRAVAGVRKQMPDAVLLLAGDGDERTEMEKLVEELGVQANVRFLGVRKDISDLMAAADVFLLSSVSEGVSVTLLEAMACRVPVVATDVGGNPEVVDAGVTGLLAPRGDDVGLAEHLTTLLSDAVMRERMGEAGRSRALGMFTEAQMHDAFAQLYVDMAAGRHSDTRPQAPAADSHEAVR